MNTITLTRDKIYEGELILINAVHPLRCVRMEELVPVKAGYPDILLNRKAAGCKRCWMRLAPQGR